MGVGGPRLSRKAILVGVIGFAILCASFGPRPPQVLEVPFDRHHLVGDPAFRDAAAVSQRDIELFLRHTPHGRATALATVRAADGRSAAAWIAAESQRVGLNPIALLAKLQVEQSLIGRDRATPRAIERALGCNCPDGATCAEVTRGFERQVRCAADKLIHYFDELSDRGASRSLWRVSSPRRSACGAVVEPSSRATASLYTYTPFVLEQRGGNWLFHTIFRRYAHYL